MTISETKDDFEAALALLRRDYPQIEVVELVVTDLNGVPRGKLLPADALDKLAGGGTKLPVSTVALDIFGVDVARAAIAIEIGDPDGVLMPVAETLAPMSWTLQDARPAAQVLASLTEADGSAPAKISPRAALQRVAARAADMGYTPVVAIEIEFYLIDVELDAHRRPQPPIPPGRADRLYRNQIYDMTVLRAFEPLMAEITEAVRMLGAPADTIICEFGPGQFEMNLKHVADPVAAADDAILLRRAIRGVARRNGYDATFMAKPYGDSAGSGMHMHLSLLDAEGRNVFSGKDGAPNAAMRKALGGMMATMPDGMAVFAPHFNSYRRFMPGSYAPLRAAWGLDNRGTALRCPETSGPGARIEHRVSGADANPYLVAAHILAGALHGLEKGLDCGDPVDGEAVKDGDPLPATWTEAIATWEQSDIVEWAFGGELRRVYAAMKRQEQETLMAQVTDAEYGAYLTTL